MFFGLLIFIFFVIGILYLRKRIFESDNEALKTVVRIGDIIIWFRFLLFFIPFIAIFLFLYIKSK